ncbi:MAG: bifunctional hydroxymethylpyrimidine kinase/phosphomethylpyrimidine kinase, partial [Gemmatimonadaceae bacterium]
MTDAELPADGIHQPSVLSIAGSDPSGGAGIQADLKTFAAFSVYGTAAITAVTAQNSRAVAGVLPIDAAFVRLQLQTAFDDAEFDAIKIGMLGNADVAAAVADAIASNGNENIVLDPVLMSTSGRSLLEGDGVDVLRERLFPLALLVTPNASEAGVLLDRAAPTSIDEMHQASHDLLALGSRWVLVKGGHVGDGNLSVDVLCGRNGETHELRVPRVVGAGWRGTGCTLSSAIAALVATGHDV